MPRVVIADTSAKPRHRNKVWDQVEQINSGAPRGPSRRLVRAHRPPVAQRSASPPKSKANEAPDRYGAIDPPDPDPGSPDHGCDITYDPSQGGRDVTIHLQLAIEEDPDRDMDEFLRLVRLGRFNDSRAHYAAIPKLGDGVLTDQLRLAQMLLAAGDYKGLRQVTGKYRCMMEKRKDSESWDLGARLNLVRLLFSQHQRSEGNENELLPYIFKYMRTLERARKITLPEIRVLVLCLQGLHALEAGMGSQALLRHVADKKLSTKQAFFWPGVYNIILAEGNDWDFRDLFVSAVSLFGWEETLIDLFGTTSDALVLETILRDWKAPGYAESNTMCLLDLFTSLILQDPSQRMKTRNLLLLEKARPLAEAIHRNEEQMMRTRPFVQWLLAKTVVEMDSPPGQMEGGRLGDKGGFVVNQGTGIHLPIYIPTRSNNKPEWRAFSSKSSPAQCRAAEIAAAAAHYIGDYTTEATALKLLILQSHDPRKWVDALCHLQANTQGDNEGYVATSLSRYLLSRDEHEEAELLRAFQAPGGPIDLLSSGRCHYPQVMWALILIQMRLKAMDSEMLLIGQRVFAMVESEEPAPNQLSTVELGQIKDLVPRSLANYAWKEFLIPLDKKVEILVNNKALVLETDRHRSGEDDGGSEDDTDCESLASSRDRSYEYCPPSDLEYARARRRLAERFGQNRLKQAREGTRYQRDARYDPGIIYREVSPWLRRARREQRHSNPQEEASRGIRFRLRRGGAGRGFSEVPSWRDTGAHDSILSYTDDDDDDNDEKMAGRLGRSDAKRKQAFFEGFSKGFESHVVFNGRDDEKLAEHAVDLPYRRPFPTAMDNDEDDQLSIESFEHPEDPSSFLVPTRRFLPKRSTMPRVGSNKNVPQDAGTATAEDDAEPAEPPSGSALAGDGISGQDRGGAEDEVAWREYPDGLVLRVRDTYTQGKGEKRSDRNTTIQAKNQEQAHDNVDGDGRDEVARTQPAVLRKPGLDDADDKTPVAPSARVNQGEKGKGLDLREQNPGLRKGLEDKSVVRSRGRRGSI